MENIKNGSKGKQSNLFFSSISDEEKKVTQGLRQGPVL
jgi:hypothetical protein